MTPIKFANPRGIPCLDSVSVVLSTTALTINFAEHPYFRDNFQGLFLIRINQTYTAPATAVPVVFVTNNMASTAINLTDLDGANLTTEQFDKTGIYLCFYDRPTNVLQLISRN